MPRLSQMAGRRGRIHNEHEHSSNQRAPFHGHKNADERQFACLPTTLWSKRSAARSSRRRFASQFLHPDQQRRLPARRRREATTATRRANSAGERKRCANLRATQGIASALARHCSREGFDAGARAFALPLVVPAQLGLVFLYLGFQLAERFLATGSHAGRRAGGVQGS